MGKRDPRHYGSGSPHFRLAAGGVGGNQTRVSHYRTVTLQSDYSNQFKAFGMDHEAIAGGHSASHRPVDARFP